MERSGTRAAVLVLRVWREPGTPGIRGRLTSTLDLEGREQSTLVSSSVTELCAAVREWLETFADETTGAPEARPRRE